MITALLKSRFWRILSVIFMNYGVAILLIIGRGAVFNWFFLCLGVIMFLLSAFWEKTGMAFRKIMTIFTVIMLVLFVIIEGCVISRAISVPDPDADYVILLGTQVRDNGISVDFKARIEAAARYLKENPDSLIIVSGGQGNDEPMSEAEAGKDYLMELGIDKERIIMEDESFSTMENLTNSADIILSRHDDFVNCKVVIVSASYHLFRAEYLARNIGYHNVSSMGSNGLIILMPHWYVREFFAFIKEVVVCTFYRGAFALRLMEVAG